MRGYFGPSVDWVDDTDEKYWRFYTYCCEEPEEYFEVFEISYENH